jgi:hypothetical protein
MKGIEGSSLMAKKVHPKEEGAEQNMNKDQQD